MFEIEMLPAREGDCLWIRYGDPDAPSQILIDGGRSSTYEDIKQRFADLPENQRTFELFVITHVDRDHIEGALALLEDPDLDLAFEEIWFNGYDHLQNVALETFGALQGERLTTALLRRKARWNTAFSGGPVKVADDGSLPSHTLAGGLTLTVLSPDSGKLAKLLPQWEAECAAAGVQPGVDARRTEVEGLESFGGVPDIEMLAVRKTKLDATLPNGSSIALLAEYDGVRVLLGADAHTDRLTASLQTLATDGEAFALDAFKLSHHGSSGNVSQELLALIRCQNYLISTNGSYFKHPTAEAIARVIKFGGPDKTLHFNYASDYTRLWDEEGLRRDYDFRVQFPMRSEEDDENEWGGTLRVTLGGGQP
jgi:beta-lactamase superfamily II metal-dependent hydrolase